MKKAFVAVFTLLVLATLFLTGCGSQKFDEERINFDLSEYNDHGNLSCGLIWVQKTESTWDSVPQDYFAYFDTDGNRKSEWFSCNEYQPEDFQNNYVVLRGERRAFEDIWDYYRCTVYNKSFYKITSLYCRKPAVSSCYISDFDTQGYSFAVAYDEMQKDDVLYWIDAQGEHIFQDPIDGAAYSSTSSIDEYSLRKFKYSNDYFVLVDGSSDPNYLYTKIAQIYDKSGRFILDIEYQMQKHTEECAITRAEVLDDNVVEFYFYGMDKNRYACIMDFNGEFIKTPVLASEYKRDESLLYSQSTTTVAKPTTTVAEGKVTYTVTVIDEYGNPISGVYLQLYLESCMPCMTNVQGVATWPNYDEEDYKVSFMMLPVGYSSDVNEFHFEDGSYEMTIVLNAVD